MKAEDNDRLRIIRGNLERYSAISNHSIRSAIAAEATLIYIKWANHTTCLPLFALAMDFRRLITFTTKKYTGFDFETSKFFEPWEKKIFWALSVDYENLEKYYSFINK